MFFPREKIKHNTGNNNTSIGEFAVVVANESCNNSISFR